MKNSRCKVRLYLKISFAKFRPQVSVCWHRLMTQLLHHALNYTRIFVLQVTWTIIHFEVKPVFQQNIFPQHFLTHCTWKSHWQLVSFYVNIFMMSRAPLSCSSPRIGVVTCSRGWTLVSYMMVIIVLQWSCTFVSDQQVWYKYIWNTLWH